jgi:inosose dehydratase
MISSSIKVANAPCSWGVLEFNLPGQGAAYVRVLDEIQQTGYAGTELGDWGFMPTDPMVLKDELKKRWLEMVGAFVPVAFNLEAAYADGEKRALQTARLLSDAFGQSPFIVLADDNGKDVTRTKFAGRITAAQSLKTEQWKSYGERVNRIARAIHEQTGLRSVFHHHCAGLVETPNEIESLLAHTDPALVGLCFDTGHYRFGGGADPVEWLKKHRQRIWHVHFKDCNPIVHHQSKEQEWNYFQSLEHGIFCELGRGDVPFAAVLAALIHSDYQGWIVVEQDILPGMGSPKEYAASNREFLRKIGV